VIAVAKAIVVAICIIGFVAALWLGRQRLLALWQDRPHVILLIAAYLLVPVMMWLHGYLGQPILIGRGMLYAVPGMILLITGLCLVLEQRAAILASCAVLALFGLSTLLTGTIREREDWRGAYAFLAGVAAPGDVIALCPAFNYPALRYHATALVGAPVITLVDGRLVEVEQSLGGNRAWDQTYFQALIAPYVTARLAGTSMPLDHLGTAKAVALAPGQSIWRIDGHCSDPSIMDSLLVVTRQSSGIVRFEDDTPNAGSISIRQYRVTEPTAFEVRSLVAPPAFASD
jgi:hypothetical protein